MKILVTESTGRIGRYALGDLVATGHEVTGADLVPGGEPGARRLLVDPTDARQVGAVSRRHRYRTTSGPISTYLSSGALAGGSCFPDELPARRDWFRLGPDLSIIGAASAPGGVR